MQVLSEGLSDRKVASDETMAGNEGDCLTIQKLQLAHEVAQQDMRISHKQELEKVQQELEKAQAALHSNNCIEL